MTKEEWKAFEHCLSGYFGHAKLRVDGHNVSFNRFLSKNRLLIMTYIDGTFKGKWLAHDYSGPELNYLRPCTRYIHSPKKREALKKMSKRQRSILGEYYDPDNKFLYYTPAWTNATQIRRHYQKTFSSIELVEVNSVG